MQILSLIEMGIPKQLPTLSPDLIFLSIWRACSIAFEFTCKNACSLSSTCFILSMVAETKSSAEIFPFFTSSRAVFSSRY